MSWSSTRRTSRSASYRSAARSLVLENKAVCLEETGAYLHSATVTVPAPSVVRLKHFVRVPYQGPSHSPAGRCSPVTGADACTAVASPPVSTTSSRAAAGASTSGNVVASCRRCNHVKADRHLFELGWHLRHKPAPPTGLAWRIIGTGHRDPRWLPYLQPYGADDALARIDGISA
ncbi:HNH endonuclease OS=Streptomyces tendae OX=1932 GN=F3L20_26695 PE=4 SV=1 [Streptomyces tendae]